MGISIINVVEIIYFSLRLICCRRRGTVIDRVEAVADNVSTTSMQDADTAAAPIRRETKTAKSKVELAKRLNTVKVIDIDEAPLPSPPLRRLSVEQETQLYWQEFVKPINKASVNK